MMYGNATSLQAAALTRHQMGLHGVYARPRPLDASRGFSVRRPHRSLGAVDTDALKTVGLDATTAFISSGFDVDSLYEPAFAAIGIFVAAIPPPGNLIVGAGLSAAKIGTDAIRNSIKTLMRSAGQYLPLAVSEKLIQNIVKQNTLDWWKRVAKDKFVEFGRESFAVGAAIAAFNAAAPANDRLDLKVQTRTADQAYKLAQQYGATQWQAAMLAYKMCQNTGATEAKFKYAALVGDVSNPEAAWKAKMGQSGGKQVGVEEAEDILEGKVPAGGKKDDKKDDKKKEGGKISTPALIGVGALALAVLAR
jgi:hypothetical protein